MINNEKIALLMSFLRYKGRWNLPPVKYIDFGKHFSFIAVLHNLDWYLFSLARLMSFMIPRRISICKGILKSIVYDEGLKLPTNNEVKDLYDKLIEVLTPRQIYVLQKKGGTSW
jgi:hypothetical protein